MIVAVILGGKLPDNVIAVATETFKPTFVGMFWALVDPIIMILPVFFCSNCGEFIYP